MPVSPSNAPEFANCITDWLVDNDATPIYLSGMEGSVETEDDAGGRDLYGVSTGDGDALLAETDIGAPEHAGLITGPTGALLNRAGEIGVDSVGLLVESTGDLPDFDAALTVTERGLELILDVEFDTERFAERSIEMSSVAESALTRMEDSVDGTTHAEPTATFH